MELEEARKKSEKLGMLVSVSQNVIQGKGMEG